MAVSNRHILRQGPVIAALGRTALAALWQQLGRVEAKTPQVPGPELTRRLPPRPDDLVRDYVRHVGGDPNTYRGSLPPHLFPQWGFGIAGRTLEGLPYPLHKGLNAGCRLEINEPLPSGKPLNVRVRLEEIDDNGRRAVIRQRLVTGTDQVPGALVAYMVALVPLGGGGGRSGEKGGNGEARASDGGGSAQEGAAGKPQPPKRREKARVPAGAREVDFWRLGPKAGLDFAKLTGDFNPVHWIPPYARAFGFRNTILHGFSTLARAMEGLNRELFSGATPIQTFDVRFTRPLVLPARVGLYIDGEGGVSVGDAPGGPAYMVGTYTVRS
jgi:acyl dehydratase